MGFELEFTSPIDFRKPGEISDTPADSSIVDNATLRLVQVDDLHGSVDHTRTKLGSASLRRSLTTPTTSASEITAMQEGVRELQERPEVREGMETYLDTVAGAESGMYELLEGKIAPVNIYSGYKDARKAGQDMLEGASDLPEVDTPYLQEVREHIQAGSSTDAAKLLTEPLYRTRGGLKPRSEVSAVTPRWRFHPRSTTGGTLAIPAFLAGEVAAINSGVHIPPEIVIESPVLGLPEIIYLMGVKRVLDHSSVIIPLRRRLVEDGDFMDFLGAVGELDKLVSAATYHQRAPYDTVLPTVTADPRHHFAAKDLRNPVLAKDNPDYVPNDIDLTDVGVTFLTGPNSGGKSTLARTVIQAQLLAQAGYPVAASEATINVVDDGSIIRYQAPQFDALEDTEGRFGTELAQTRDIFYSTTPRSFVALDELAEGTTTEETREVSRDIVDGFLAVGNNTVLVTHNHQLAQEYQDVGQGQFLQAEFDGTEPTHRIIPGISTESHADEIAERLGFSRDDIQRHLREKRYTE